MVLKGMWTCLLAYNMIRRAMLQSTRGSGTSPRALSFNPAVQGIATGWQVLAASTGSVAAGSVEAVLESLAGTPSVTAPAG